MTDRGSQILIGVDGGGSGCRAAVARADLTLLGSGVAGPANASTDFDQAVANVGHAVERALRQAGLPPEAAAGAGFHAGLAGVLTPKIAARLATALGRAPGQITDDRETALTGALGTGDGFLLALGTGTIAAARQGGQVRCLGGWGLVLSDQASGGWLGRMALARSLEANDGTRSASDLSRALLGRFGADPNRVSQFAQSAAPADFAALAPLVIEAAEAGDPLGGDLMRAGADYLVRALGALGFTPGARLCLAGGVGRFYAPYLPEPHLAGLIDPLGSGLDGALRLAARGVVA